MYIIGVHSIYTYIVIFFFVVSLLFPSTPPSSHKGTQENQTEESILGVDWSQRGN